MTPEERFFFDTHGWIVLRGVLDTEELAAANRELDSAYDVWRTDDQRLGIRRDDYHQIASIIEYAPRFLDLMEHPKTLPYIRELLGADVQLLSSDGQVKPAQTQAHTGWHFDESLLGVHHPGSTMMVKLYFALSRFDVDTGATAFVPGSHRFPNGYPFPRVSRVEDMPNFEQVRAAPGDAFIFHCHAYHCSMPNRSVEARRAVMYHYGHFYMKAWGGYEPSEALRRSASTPLRRQLLGVGDPYTQYLKE